MIWAGISNPLDVELERSVHAENTCVEIRGNAKFTPFKDLSDLKNENANVAHR